MKKVFVSLFLIVVATFTYAQGRTAFVSTEEIFGRIPQTLVADSLITLEGDRLNSLYNERESELNDLIQLFIKDSINMVDSVKQDKRLKLQGKVTDLSKLKEELKEQLEIFKQTQIRPIQDRVIKEINLFAKAKGFSTVLLRESAIVIPPGTDITYEIIKKLGGKLPEPAKPSTTTNKQKGKG